MFINNTNEEKYRTKHDIDKGNYLLDNFHLSPILRFPIFKWITWGTGLSKLPLTLVYVPVVPHF
jgi:hypothetical protein